MSEFDITPPGAALRSEKESRLAANCGLGTTCPLGTQDLTTL